MRSSATFETDRAGRYLTALCHHFGRKVDATCDDKSGQIQFGFGQCQMTADEIKLAFTVTADDQAQLDQVIQIVTNHLDRFAFRENPDLVWKET